MFNSSILRALIKDESGQNLIEYALVAGLVGLAAVAAMTTLGSNVKTAFSKVGSSVSSAVN